MSIGIIGKKAGMTRVFTESGSSVPVTVIEVVANRVTQLKTIDNDGYAAVQVTSGSVKSQRVNKPKSGHFAKANVPAGNGLWEFPLAAEEVDAFKVGDEISLDLFKPGQKVDARGTSIGKGFAGVIKRYNFSMQDATHGNSLAHRAPGSIGQNQSPGRVFKGKKMAGHMGNVRRTIQNLEVVQVRPEDNVILIKGAVPGPRGGNVVLKHAVKAKSND